MKIQDEKTLAVVGERSFGIGVLARPHPYPLHTFSSITRSLLARLPCNPDEEGDIGEGRNQLMRGSDDNK